MTTKNQSSNLDGKVALVTGAARRIGRRITEHLHNAGTNVAVHYRSSSEEADELCEALNQQRANSAASFAADLLNPSAPEQLMSDITAHFGQLDILINNASSFYPTPLGTVTEEHWVDLMGSNLKAPLFLSQAAMPHLTSARGNIINIIDINATRPLRDHPVYCAAKAGLLMLTRSMARDLAPDIRVNGVSPGAIMWPENDITEDEKISILNRVPLQRVGDPNDIAKTVLFLLKDAGYISGQIIAVDGGRSIGW